MMSPVTDRMKGVMIICVGVAFCIFAAPLFGQDSIRHRGNGNVTVDKGSPYFEAFAYLCGAWQVVTGILTIKQNRFPPKLRK